MIYLVTNQNSNYILIAFLFDEVFEGGYLLLQALTVPGDVDEVDCADSSAEEPCGERPVLVGLLPEPDSGFHLGFTWHLDFLLLVVTLQGYRMSPMFLIILLDIGRNEGLFARFFVAEH